MTEADRLPAEAASTPRPTWGHKLSGTAASVMFFVYPFVVYAAMRWWSPRAAMLAMLAVMLPASWLRIRSAPPGSLGPMAWIPGITVVLLGIGAVLGRIGLALWTPVAVNAALCLTFATTLRRGTPLVERFARMMISDLRPEELRWCRTWTLLWSLFFVLSGSVAAVLALYAPIEIWTLYTGLLGYLAIGVVFGIEYTLRKLRFGRLEDHVLDRALAWLFLRSRKVAP